MALNAMFDIYYVIDIQLFEAYGDLGSGIAKTVTSLLTLLTVVSISYIVIYQ
jgi:hypothetical protein